VIAAALAATVVAGDASGLAQRVGLTTGDTWLIATGITLLARSRRAEAARSSVERTR
jgi:hypothetical protein